MESPSNSQLQRETQEVLQAFAESVRQADAGELKEARPAIRALLDELKLKHSKEQMGAE